MTSELMFLYRAFPGVETPDPILINLAVKSNEALPAAATKPLSSSVPDFFFCMVGTCNGLPCIGTFFPFSTVSSQLLSVHSRPTPTSQLIFSTVSEHAVNITIIHTPEQGSLMNSTLQNWIGAVIYHSGGSTHKCMILAVFYNIVILISCVEFASLQFRAAGNEGMESGRKHYVKAVIYMLF